MFEADFVRGTWSKCGGNGTTGREGGEEAVEQETAAPVVLEVKAKILIAAIYLFLSFKHCSAHWSPVFASLSVSSLQPSHDWGFKLPPSYTLLFLWCKHRSPDLSLLFLQASQLLYSYNYCDQNLWDCWTIGAGNARVTCGVLWRTCQAL